MANAAAAAASWIPIPGLSVLLGRSNRDDRLVRFHSRQATWVIVPFYVLVLGLGLLLGAAPAAGPALSPVGAIPMAVLVCACVVGGVAGARGRYVRIRPVWDLLAR